MRKIINWDLILNLGSINVLNSIVPVLTLIVLKGFVSDEDFSNFIVNYSTILFSLSMFDFGFRNYFLTLSNRTNVNDKVVISADRIRFSLLIILCVFIILFAFIENRHKLLFFLPLLFKDYFFVIYKYQMLERLKIFNTQLIIFQILIISGLFATVFQNDISYLYYGYSVASIILVFLGFNFLPSKLNLIQKKDFALVKIILPVSLSNIFTSLNQNLYKVLIDFLIPSLLIGYEIVNKLVSVFKILINFVTEYIQVDNNKLSWKISYYSAICIYLLSFFSFYITENIWSSYFEIAPYQVYMYSLILIVITLTSINHRVSLILSGKLKIQLVSIFCGNLFLFLSTIFLYRFLDLTNLLILTMATEAIILLTTIYFNYEKKI
jgi:hypothetical protein